MSKIALEFRDNQGRFRILVPVGCVGCGKPLKDEPRYAASRAGLGVFYHCVECAGGEEGAGQ